MNPLAIDLGDAHGEAHLTIRLHLVSNGGQHCWQGRVEEDADARRCFESLPELIAWLAQLQWQTCGASGVK